MRKDQKRILFFSLEMLVIEYNSGTFLFIQKLASNSEHLTIKITYEIT